MLKQAGGALAALGYASCYEEPAVTAKGRRSFIMHFGHFFFRISVERDYPEPLVTLYAVDDCPPEKFFGKLREGLGREHRPHEAAPTAASEYLDHVRTIREAFVGLDNETPATGSYMAGRLGDFTKGE